MSAIAVEIPSAIIVKEFNKYLTLLGSPNKASVFSKITHYYRITTYTEKGQRYFTRSIETLASDCGLSIRTIKAYLREFKDKNLIKTWCKVHNYRKQIRITLTENLLVLIGIKTSSTAKDCTLQSDTDARTYIRNKESINNHKTILLSNTSITGNSDSADILKTCNAQNNDFDLINDLELSKPSTEELADSYAEYEQQSQTKEKIQLGQSNQPQATKHSAKPPRKPVEQQITETLAKTQKKYVKSVTSNLGTRIEITKPEKLTTEIEQAITNPKRFSKATSFKHKMNIIAKTILSGNWHAPIDAVNDNTGSHDAFKVVHVSRDEDGHNLIEVEQSTQAPPRFSPEHQVMQDSLNEIFERAQAERFKL